MFLFANCVSISSLLIEVKTYSNSNLPTAEQTFQMTKRIREAKMIMRAFILHYIL